MGELERNRQNVVAFYDHVQSVPAKRCHRSRQDFYCPVRSMTASVLSTGGGFHLPVRASDDALLD
jgi:hypothetical protein